MGRIPNSGRPDVSAKDGGVVANQLRAAAARHHHRRSRPPGLPQGRGWLRAAEGAAPEARYPSQETEDRGTVCRDRLRRARRARRPLLRRAADRRVPPRI